VADIVGARLAYRIEVHSMQKILAKLLTLSVRFFERSGAGDLVMAAYQDVKGVRTIVVQLSVMLLSLSRLVALGIVAWVMSPRLAFIGLVALPLGMLPAYWLGQRITQAARRQRQATATLHDSFLELSSGIRVIKVNRAEARVLDRARELGKALYRAVVRQAQSRSLARLLLELVAGLGLITVLIVGGQDVGAGRLDWQALLALLVAVMALYGPVVNLVSVYNSIHAIIPNLDRVDAILQRPSELPDHPAAKRLVKVPKVIELQDVCFAYDDRMVLDSLSVRFHQGESIGIVGPSGVGKSTLIALLLRFYDPTRGRILFDGADLREIRHADLMDQCAIVLQEPFLFVDTIANNIRFTCPEAPMEDVIAAAKAADIHEEIMLAEHGYDTIIGQHQRGRGLSTGQKQRICIASALLKNAPLLFLDEATSNLDSVSERAVHRAIVRLMAGRTSFVIAHRLSTLRSMHRILVLDQGRMVGFGTHDELLDMCPLYRVHWEHQDIAASPVGLLAPTPGNGAMAG
jgi:subfamily B ATP-binding cassette protein MsbA